MPPISTEPGPTYREWNLFSGEPRLYVISCVGVILPERRMLSTFKVFVVLLNVKFALVPKSPETLNCIYLSNPAGPGKFCIDWIVFDSPPR